MAKNTNLATMLEGYRLYCIAEGKSSRTIRWYQGKLHLFAGYLEEQGLPSDVAELTTTHLRAFLVHLMEQVKADQNNPKKPTQERSLSAKTIQGYARTLKAFCSWLAREGYTADNLGRALKIPKAPNTIVQTFSDAQIKALLSVVDQRGHRGFRDYCMLLVLLDTGIRLSELVGLRLVDVDWERGVFKVMGKGAKERFVPFGAKVQTSLWKYVHKYRPEPLHPSVDTLFLRSSGVPLRGDEVYRWIRKYGEKASLEGVRCSPHTFRHTFAKKFLTNGGDLFSLQKILGHTSLEVVRMYVQLTSEDVQVQHRQYSPVDRIKL
ncbi:MAG TPA: tyrosine-type recombinase/integrase [Anaerolineae bacterium]|nr:tyrosine-type recombinase/integrase [Anaerolineae bacterium]HOR00077.1 tyrosine-type recombinase/integrase [Anaerolineae bacterium]HPL30068.1 tyrosine-type recombinase/integrase [Anaerolineae bacterium]